MIYPTGPDAYDTGEFVELPQAHRLANWVQGRSRSPARSSMNCAKPTATARSSGPLIAAVLQGTPELTVQELIMALNQEFGWKCTESNLTGHLYTNPKCSRIPRLIAPVRIRSGGR